MPSSYTTFHHVLFSEGVSGYTYCWRWLLINSVPSYQPTHDWLLSTKRGEKNRQRGVWGFPWETVRLALILKRDFRKILKTCMCVFKFVHMGVYTVIFVVMLGTKLGTHWPLWQPWMPRQHLLNCCWIWIPPSSLAPLHGWHCGCTLVSPPPEKGVGGGVRGSFRLKMTSSRYYMVHLQCKLFWTGEKMYQLLNIIM